MAREDASPPQHNNRHPIKRPRSRPLRRCFPLVGRGSSSRLVPVRAACAVRSRCLPHEAVCKQRAPPVLVLRCSMQHSGSCGAGGRGVEPVQQRAPVACTRANENGVERNSSVRSDAMEARARVEVSNLPVAQARFTSRLLRCSRPQTQKHHHPPVTLLHPQTATQPSIPWRVAASGSSTVAHRLTIAHVKRGSAHHASLSSCRAAAAALRAPCAVCCRCCCCS